MSRRCRASLLSSGGVGGAEGSSCGCGRSAAHPHEPCLEPLTYGEQLRDPGLELISEAQEGRTDLGAWEGNHAQGQGWEWISGSPEGEAFLGKDAFLPWWARNANGIFLDTVDQRTGDFCAKINVVTTPGPSLQSGNVFSCQLNTGYKEQEPLTRVQDGDLVTMSCHAKASAADLGVRLNIEPRDNRLGGPASAPGSLVNFIPPDDDTYHLYTHSQFIVNSSVMHFQPVYWCRIRWQAPRTGGGLGSVFFDDLSLIVTPGDGGTLLCVFAALITIDNSTTETSFLE